MLATLQGIGHDAEKITSVGEALTQFDMNWGVEVRPTFYKKNDGTYSAMDKSFATVRTDSEAMLGRVGGDYVPCNNAQALQHVDALLASGVATLDSVFELKGGRRVGASLRLNEKISIAGEDPIELFIVVTTSHDGTRADRTEITPIRLWCTNQLALASREAKQSWSVRHLSTMADNLKVVESELMLITNYAEWLQKTCDSLVDKQISMYDLEKMTNDALAFMREEERKKKIVLEVSEIFNTSQLIGDDYRGTAWGALNAVTEYVDHHRNYRTAAARYNGITNGFGARLRNNFAEMLIAA